VYKRQDEGDSWEDEKVWLKANPNLGVPGAKKMSYMRSEFVEATNSTAKSVAFKRLDLNMLIFGAAGWIKDEDWTAGDSEIDWSEISKLPCWGGLDLAQSRDFSSLVLLFFDKEKKKYFTKEYTWAPSDNLKEMAARNNPSILQWVADGWITETDGNIIDPDFMQSEIIKIIKALTDFKSLAYDRMYAYQMIANIEKEGIICAEFNQGVKNFAAPTAWIETEIKSKNLIHEKNPATRWMVSNCVIKNVNDMKKIVRDSKKYKIDTVIAMVMTYGQMLTDTAVPEAEPSVYEKRGIITF
jgi:phage terminase large subunit-like protein